MLLEKGWFCPWHPEWWVFYFPEGVDSKNGEVGVCFGVAHDIEIDEFFEFHGVGGDIFEYIHEERWYIFSIGHVGDDPSDGFLLVVDIVAV